jgi:hypothetical protein
MERQRRVPIRRLSSRDPVKRYNKYSVAYCAAELSVSEVSYSVGGKASPKVMY